MVRKTQVGLPLDETASQRRIEVPTLRAAPTPAGIHGLHKVNTQRNEVVEAPAEGMIKASDVTMPQVGLELVEALTVDELRRKLHVGGQKISGPAGGPCLLEGSWVVLHVAGHYQFNQAAPAIARAARA